MTKVGHESGDRMGRLGEHVGIELGNIGDSWVWEAHSFLSYFKCYS